MVEQTTILIVDDEPDNFDVIEGLLYKYDYHLFYASNGQKAIQQLDTLQPDLILLDVMMPEMDGIEVCQLLKNNPKYISIPIIMVTALTAKEDLAHCLEAGADDFISKPLNRLELAARVKSMLRIKRQHDDLEKLLKFREDMVNIIIHDFRNPLTNIIMAAGILKMPKFPVEKYGEKIEQIIQSSERLKTEINKLLEIAKIQSIDLVIHKKNTNIILLCEEVIASFKLTANAENIDLIFENKASIHELNIDKKIFYSVIDNLISNALKFSSFNSKIILEIFNTSDNFYFRVIDFGEGISDADKIAIFDKFYVGATIKKVNQIGLGLSFCKMAIQAHGGTISVEDNPEKGAIFTIKLPLTS